MRTRAAIIIPARLAATRLPRKPLLDLGGLPLVVRVEQQARKCAGIDCVMVATDTSEIMEAVEAHNGRAVMTRREHASGTDRVAEVAENLEADVIVNLQGDEPFVDPRDLEIVIATLRGGEADIATLRVPIENSDDFADPSVVKVVARDDGRALYFSRAPIPYDRRRDGGVEDTFRHLGIYAYRRTVLRRLAAAPVHPLERRERLEQLRALGIGMSIAVRDGQTRARGIDSEEDLAWARARVGELGEAAFP